MTIEQLMQMFKQNPQLLQALVQMLMQAGIVGPPQGGQGRPPGMPPGGGGRPPMPPGGAPQMQRPQGPPPGPPQGGPPPGMMRR